MPCQKLFFVGPFPPPVHGFAVITKALAAALEPRTNIRRLNNAFKTNAPRPVYHLARLLICLGHCLQISAACFGQRQTLYVGCNHKVGILYTAMYVLSGRLLSGPIYLHHHSFEYIHDDSRWMRLLLWVAPKRAIHIFLCPKMKELFIIRYGHVESIILENSAFVPVPENATPRPPDGSIVIGLLSNLTREKGLYTFLALLAEATRAGLPIRGILAGRSAGKDRAAIEAALADPALALTYLGAVYGEDKAQFYNCIDIFVFPTEYRTEAQPTVVFEAQAHGRPVIARGLACIPGQLYGGPGCLEPGVDFVPEALRLLQSFALDNTLAALQSDTMHRYSAAHQAALRQIDQLAQL